MKRIRATSTSTVSIWLWLTAGTTAIVVAATLASLSGWPPEIIPRVGVEPIPDTVWSAPWSENARTPAATQAGAVRTLVTTVVSLAAASFALALINVLALLAVRRLRERRNDAIRVALGATRSTMLSARWRENRRDLIGGAAIALVASVGAVALAFATWPDGLIAGTDRSPIAALVAIPLFFVLLAGWNAISSSRLLQPAGELAGGTATSSRRRVRENAFVAVIQIGLAVALATASLLLYRNGSVSEDSLAFATDGMVTADLRFATPVAPAESAAAYKALLERAAETPGLENGTLSSPGTWLGIGTRDRVMFECGACALGGMMLPLQMRVVSHHAISPGFFTSLGIDVVDGREFGADDRLGNERVAIVNTTFATTAFESGQPIGRKLQIGGLRGEWYTIVGVVPDLTGSGIGAAKGAMPALFVPILQLPPLEATFTARTVAGIGSLEQLSALLPNESSGISVTAVALLADRLTRAVEPVRWAGLLLGTLGIVALLLSLHGVHASLDAQVRNRRRELAVRSAFGASPRRLAGHVIARTIRLLITGIVFGLAIAFVAARSLETRIGGIPVLDAAPIIAIAFAAVALAGATSAIRRAARTSPARALAEY